MLAISAQCCCRITKTDTKQEFLNGEIGDEKIYICPPDWWPEPIPQGLGHALVDEELVLNSAGCKSMASDNFGWMDGVT